MSVIPLYKKIGETPLETIRRFKSEHQEYNSEPMSYAGRLDPMAEGLLLVLSGPELKNKDKYQKLKKTYIADVLFGIESDTQDILGLIKNSGKSNISKEQLDSAITKMYGDIEIELPHYASYKINGKPLFWWARQNRIKEIEIPKRIVTISSSSFISLQTKTGKEIKNEVIKKIMLVHGDFRQNEVVSLWDTIDIKKNYIVAQIRFECSGGTYIRSLVSIIGKKLKTSALLFHLKRIEVGAYSISDCIK
jgi:tRNA pseudouridine55 synthase